METQKKLSSKRKIIFSLLLFLIFSSALTIILELYIRHATFNSNSFGHGVFGNPMCYGDFFSDDDYWKLRYILGDKYNPPDNPHPILGWVGDFEPNTYIHNNASNIGDRSVVLLYGDSFAECSTDICFEDILNSDSALSQNYFFLNYGVSGYGTDQIKILYDNSIGHYDQSIVIFSFLTNDLDRSILSYRIGQKPFFEPVKGKLELKGFPIRKTSDEFLRENPISIRSYLWNFIIYSSLFPEPFGSWLRGDQKKIDRKIEVNELILRSVIDNLEERGIPYFFIVFHANWPDKILGSDSWRDNFVRDFLEENNIPYIWTKGLIIQNMEETGLSIEEYFLSGDGHYSDYTNELVANEIKRRMLENDYNNPRAHE